VIDIVWSEKSLDSDNRSHYASSTMLNESFDGAFGSDGAVHRNGFEQLPANAEGAIVLVHGEHQNGDARALVDRVARLGWAIVIVFGDEPGSFPARLFMGNRKVVWVQYPIPGRHDYAQRRFICGYPNEIRIARAMPEMPRDLDWFFSGQINHARRVSCVNELKKLRNGVLKENPSFWFGYPHDEYYQYMKRAKVIPCPSGGATPDTIRLAEALECGCVPIADDRYPPFHPHNMAPGMCGYWEFVLRERPPFPILNDWRHLPQIMDDVLRNWDKYRAVLGPWWEKYKSSYGAWLKEDLRIVGAA